MEASPVVHPSEKTLRPYGLGKFDDHQAEAVNRHLKDCAACQSRVAEMTSDTFLGRLRDAQARPGSVLPVGSSIAGISKLDAGSSQTMPPPASTLPPGLAEHPDYHGELATQRSGGSEGTMAVSQSSRLAKNSQTRCLVDSLLFVDRRRNELSSGLQPLRHLHERAGLGRPRRLAGRVRDRACAGRSR